MLCPNCQYECSSRALSCPNCGEPFSPESMPVLKTHAALFAFFLGLFGIHDFILGKTLRGIIKLFFSLLGIFAIIVAIWNIIDLYHIYKGTYPAVGKYFIGEDSIAKALFIISLVLSIFAFLIGLLGVLFVGAQSLFT